MRIVSCILLCVLPKLLFGQYTYFNIGLLPVGGQNAGVGFATELFSIGDTLIAIGAYPNNNDFVVSFRKLDNTGFEFATINNDSGNGYLLTNYGDAFDYNENKLIRAGSTSSSDYPNLVPSISRYSINLLQTWLEELPELSTDTSQAEFHLARILSDESVIAAGPISIDIDQNANGYNYCDLLVCKYSDLNEMMWTVEIPLAQEAGLIEPWPFLRISSIFELFNGDLLLFGAWYNDYQPFAIRLSPDGTFIDHVSWGNSTQNDWLPWAVQIAPDTFMFAYQHATGTAPQGEDFVEHKPRVGILDASTMEVSDFTMYDHYHVFGNVTDFEQTPDGGFVILGYGGDEPLVGDAFEEAYMLKIDAVGNELWYKSYDPPIEHVTSEVWDLEITNDGGLAFVGNFEIPNPSYYHSWVVKTDACGDELFNGCPVGISELQISNSKFQIAPNPANDVVNISSTQEFESITIRDITGRIVYKEQMPNHTLNKRLSVKEFGVAGLYLVEVDYGGGRVGAQKLVVE